MANPENPKSGREKFIERFFHPSKKPVNQPKAFEPITQKEVSPVTEAALILLLQVLLPSALILWRGKIKRKLPGLTTTIVIGAVTVMSRV